MSFWYKYYYIESKDSFLYKKPFQISSLPVLLIEKYASILISIQFYTFIAYHYKQWAHETHNNLDDNKFRHVISCNFVHIKRSPSTQFYPLFCCQKFCKISATDDYTNTRCLRFFLPCIKYDWSPNSCISCLLIYTPITNSYQMSCRCFYQIRTF